MNKEKLINQVFNLVAGLVTEHYAERKEEGLEEQLFSKIRELLPFAEPAADAVTYEKKNRG